MPKTKSDAAPNGATEETPQTFYVTVVVKALPSEVDEFNDEGKGRDYTSKLPGETYVILQPYTATTTPVTPQEPVLTKEQTDEEMPKVGQ